jgi:hypothetical protein
VINFNRYLFQDAELFTAYLDLAEGMLCQVCLP